MQYGLRILRIYRADPIDSIAIMIYNNLTKISIIKIYIIISITIQRMT